MKQPTDMRRSLAYGIGLGLTTLIILWITLISRKIDITQHIKPPFWSYRAIADGDWKILIEDVSNVLLFVPVGFFLSAIWPRTSWQTALIAFLASLLIETTQLTMKIGFFEVEDLLHNTGGAVVGWWLLHRSGWVTLRPPPIHAGVIFVATILTGLGLLGGCIGLNHAKMRAYAAMGDLENRPNLLILNGESGPVGSSDVLLQYLKDGSIRLCGTSNVRAWKLLAQMELPPGHYIFSGLTGVEANTVALELEYYVPEAEQFIRLTQDIGPVESDSFTLTETTHIRAYVGVYPGCDCDVSARVVLYREGE